MCNDERSWLVMVFIHSALSLPLQQTVVYPEFVESRSADGEKMLKITDDLVLTLEHKPAFEEQFSVTTFNEDGTEINYRERGRDYNGDFYVDRAQQASVRVSQDDGLEVHGIIGEAVRIEPIWVRERSDRGQVAHLLTREKLKDMPHHLNYADSSLLKATIDEPRTSARHLEKRSNDIINPEIHLVIDSILFRAFHNSTTKIFQYYGVVLNAVNLRLDTITSLKVEAKITGFTIHNGSVEPYFDIQFYGNTYYIDDMGTLERLNDYYQKYRRDTYYSADILFLITGEDIGFIYDDILDEDSQGIAYIGGACGNKRVGVCEDRAGSFDVVRTLAHEMGHSLGCTHDGSDPDKEIPNHPSATSCEWKSGFLMSYVQEDLSQYKFSSCCAKQMLHVSKLDQYKCLKDSNGASTTLAPPKMLPGSNTSLDEQCRQGVSYEFQYDTYHSLSGCLLVCVRPASQERSRPYYRRIRSLDGTPCKSNTSMVCIGGECVTRPDYPYIPEVIPPFRSTTTTRPTTTIRTTSTTIATTTTATTTTTTKKNWFHRAKDWFKRKFGKGGTNKPLTPKQREFALNPWFWWKRYQERAKAKKQQHLP
ncbi:venom metalloproteinase antarease-like TtrivMP_A [Ornithodoros turicata]|uniref:venom metalloproteinase antarease-like TtrivMP_A n=1 Tax=Ornithodoros turicata TaxID=34597 RepID=UPI0031396030